jgi:hypothetical protein
VHVDGARLDEAVAAPDDIEQLVATEDTAGVPTSVASSSNSLGVSSTGRPFMRTSKR